MSPKFAKHISTLLGVDEDWLLQYPAVPGPIPAAEGGELKHTDFLRCAVKPLRSSKKLDPQTLLRSPSADQGLSMNHMVEHLMEMVRSELTAYSQNPRPDVPSPFPELFDWLYQRAEINNR